MTENWRGQDALPRYDWMRWIYVEKDLFLAIEVARSAIQRSAMALVEFQRLHDRLRIVRTHDDERGDILSTVKTDMAPAWYWPSHAVHGLPKGVGDTIKDTTSRDRTMSSKTNVTARSTTRARIAQQFGLDPG